jgi:hypothetical protein
MRFFSYTSQALSLGLLATTLASTPAVAGGLGIDILGGTHGEKVYFFDTEGNKYNELQQASTWGLGFQTILGDRDDTLIGIMKFGYINDAPASSAVNTDRAEGFEGDVSQVTARLDCEDKNAGDPCGPRALATVSAGLQWRVWGDPMGLQVSILPSVGAGIVTTDSTEYIQLELGPGVHYAFSKQLQVHAEVAYQVRYRKVFTQGATLTSGVRWLFD